jgi:hypothetical protein
MHGNSTPSILTNVKKSPNDVITRGATVNKYEVMMIKTCVDEALCLVQSIVQSNDARHSTFTEV